MHKHAIISLILIAIFVSMPFIVHAAVFVNKTSSFGGKIILTTNPIITCTGFGTGPIVLSNNVSSLGSAVVSATDPNQPTGAKTSNVASGLYGAIPYYAKTSFIAGIGGAVFVSPTPKVGSWILGRANVIPETSNCYIPWLGDLPFPVRDTNNYKVSNGPGLIN